MHWKQCFNPTIQAWLPPEPHTCGLSTKSQQMARQQCKRGKTKLHQPPTSGLKQERNSTRGWWVRQEKQLLDRSRRPSSFNDISSNASRCVASFSFVVFFTVASSGHSQVCQCQVNVSATTNECLRGCACMHNAPVLGSTAQVSVISAARWYVKIRAHFVWIFCLAAAKKLTWPCKHLCQPVLFLLKPCLCVQIFQSLLH